MLVFLHICRSVCSSPFDIDLESAASVVEAVVLFLVVDAWLEDVSAATSSARSVPIASVPAGGGATVVGLKVGNNFENNCLAQ